MLIGVALLLAALGWLALMWAIRSGQFEDVESIKYRMLEDEDEIGGDDAE